jgi:hypothetical protein
MPHLMQTYMWHSPSLLCVQMLNNFSSHTSTSVFRKYNAYMHVILLLHITGQNKENHMNTLHELSTFTCTLQCAEWSTWVWIGSVLHVVTSNVLISNISSILCAEFIQTACSHQTASTVFGHVQPLITEHMVRNTPIWKKPAWNIRRSQFNKRRILRT